MIALLQKDPAILFLPYNIDILGPNQFLYGCIFLAVYFFMGAFSIGFVLVWVLIIIILKPSFPFSDFPGGPTRIDLVNVAYFQLKQLWRHMLLSLILVNSNMQELN